MYWNSNYFNFIFKIKNKILIQINNPFLVNYKKKFIFIFLFFLI